MRGQYVSGPNNALSRVLLNEANEYFVYLLIIYRIRKYCHHINVVRKLCDPVIDWKMKRNPVIISIEELKLTMADALSVTLLIWLFIRPEKDGIKVENIFFSARDDHNNERRPYGIKPTKKGWEESKMTEAKMKCDSSSSINSFPYSFVNRGLPIFLKTNKRPMGTENLKIR